MNSVNEKGLSESTAGQASLDFLAPYINYDGDERITISADQGSRFAKDVAGDFNPIHNTDAKRFCVPGDLLFAITLLRYGLRSHMDFRFIEMLPADSEIICSKHFIDSGESPQLQDSNNRIVLDTSTRGDICYDTETIIKLIKNYIRFSAQNFPHILVPLMKQHGVMINPLRPLVIYESMGFEINLDDASDIDVTLEDTRLEVSGKRGNAYLSFTLSSNGNTIGHGQKKLVLSGLRNYDEAAVTDLTQRYLASRDAWQNASS